MKHISEKQHKRQVKQTLDHYKHGRKRLARRRAIASGLAKSAWEVYLEQKGNIEAVAPKKAVFVAPPVSKEDVILKL